MLGTIVNTLAIGAGSLLGLLLKGGIPRKYNVTMMQALSLAVILVGLQMAFKSNQILVVIFSLAIGSVVGEFLSIEARLDALGRRLEARFSKNGQGISHGFVVASLVFCVGSMAIVGSLESGLTGNHQTLFAKSALDGIASIIFAPSQFTTPSPKRSILTILRNITMTILGFERNEINETLVKTQPFPFVLETT